MKLYVASSWRNQSQPEVVSRLRGKGHVVYDFRQPSPGEKGFSWAEIEPSWQQWSVDQYRRALRHEHAVRGFRRDFEALAWCDACVLVLPSGVSSHLEAGWCKGTGKPVVVYAPELREAELMYKLFEDDRDIPLYESFDDVVACLDQLSAGQKER